jgi:hypothetical protein
MQCDEPKAVALIEKFDGTVHEATAGYRRVAQMQFADGVLVFQIEVFDIEGQHSLKRVEFDEVFNELIAVSRRRY